MALRIIDSTTEEGSGSPPGASPMPDAPAQPTSALSSRAQVSVDREGERNRYSVMKSDPPLTVRRTGSTVHIVGTTAGPLGGDRLHLDLTVGPGAALDVRSSAAQLIHPGVHGDESAMVSSAEVAAGGFLRYVPEPMILLAGCRHSAHTRLALGRGAKVIWAEMVVRGRFGESGGSAELDMRVDLAGAPVLRSSTVTGPGFEDADGPAGTGGFTAWASVLFIGVRPPEVGLSDGMRRVGVTRIAAGVWQVLAASDQVGALAAWVRAIAVHPTGFEPG